MQDEQRIEIETARQRYFRSKLADQRQSDFIDIMKAGATQAFLKRGPGWLPWENIWMNWRAPEFFS